MTRWNLAGGPIGDCAMCGRRWTRRVARRLADALAAASKLVAGQ